MAAVNDLNVETHAPNDLGLEFARHDSRATVQHVDSHRSVHYTNLLWRLIIVGWYFLVLETLVEYPEIKIEHIVVGNMLQRFFEDILLSTMNSNGTHKVDL